MLIGCGEWGFRQLPVEEHFRIASDFGFKTLEFGIGGDYPGRLAPRMTAAQIQEFRSLGESYGIATPFACIENDFTLPDPALHAAMQTETLAQIRLAADLGARQVRLFAGFTSASAMTEEIWLRMLGAFAEADALCRTIDLKIAIETHGKITMRDGSAHHEQTVSTDAASLRRLVAELPPTVGFNFDPGNLKAVAPEDHGFALDIIGERITYCHLKDWRRRGGGWEAVAIGDDDLDCRALLPMIPFDGIFLIEYEPTDDVVAGIGRSLDYLARIGQAVVFA